VLVHQGPERSGTEPLSPMIPKHCDNGPPAESVDVLSPRPAITVLLSGFLNANVVPLVSTGLRVVKIF